MFGAWFSFLSVSSDACSFALVRESVMAALWLTSSLCIAMSTFALFFTSVRYTEGLSFFSFAFLKLSRDGEGVDFREGSGDPIGEQTTTGSWACAGRF